MVFQFMFFDAVRPLYLGGFRAFYVFCLIHADLRGVPCKLNSGLTLPKDKTAKRYVLGGAERMPANPRKQ